MTFINMQLLIIIQFLFIAGKPITDMPILYLFCGEFIYKIYSLFLEKMQLLVQETFLVRISFEKGYRILCDSKIRMSMLIQEKKAQNQSEPPNTLHRGILLSIEKNLSHKLWSHCI